MSRYYLALIMPLFLSAVDFEKRAKSDALLLNAIDATNRLEYKRAEQHYKKLLDVEYTLEYKKRHLAVLLRMEIEQKKHPEVLKTAQEIVALERNGANLENLSVAYFLNNDFDNGFKTLKESYELAKNLNVLLKIGRILLEQNNTNEAIALYETHLRIYPDDDALLFDLADIYIKIKDYTALGSVYERLYQKTHNEEYANKVIEIMLIQNRTDEAVEYIKKIGIKKEVLLDIYLAKKEYDNAKKSAQELFNQTEDYNYLIKLAELEFWSSKDKKDTKMLAQVVKLLKQALAKIDHAEAQNFLGYLLIDNNIDFNEGVEYVKKAMEKEPDNLYYADSLAWGYFKLKNYDEAYRLMKLVVDTQGLAEEEVKLHWEAINKRIQK